MNKHGKSTLEIIYDRFAPAMYGSILSIVKTSKLADQLMTEIFAEFQKMFTSATSGLPDRLWFIKFAIRKTVLHLKKSGSSETGIKSEVDVPFSLHISG